jgi:hypothetical protein
LDTIREWLEEGHTLWVLREKLPYDEDLSKKALQKRTREIDERLREWSARYHAIASLANVLDPADPDLDEGDEREDLNWLMSAIVHNMPTVNLAYDRDPQQSEHAIWVMAGFFPRAIQRIHWLVEQTVDEASREVAQYRRKRG